MVRIGHNEGKLDNKVQDLTLGQYGKIYYIKID